MGTHIRKYLSIFLIGLVFAIAGCSSDSSSGVDHETDTDGDGITDNNDLDIDGDGVNNNLDPDIDGDGILNPQDPDMDGDGVLDDADDTPGGNDNPGAGSGTNKPDIDGDGIPNDKDPDKDGDGIPNDQDPTPDGDDGVEIDTGQVALAVAMESWATCLNENPSSECKTKRTTLTTLTIKEVKSSLSTINRSFDSFEGKVAGTYAAKIKYKSTSLPVTKRAESSRLVSVNYHGEHCVGMEGSTLSISGTATTYAVTDGGYDGDLLKFEKGSGYVSIADDSLLSKLCWGTPFHPRFVIDTQDEKQTFVMYLGSEVKRTQSATAVFTKTDGTILRTLTLKNDKVTSDE